MATIKTKQFYRGQFGSAPYGNLSTLAFEVATDSTGKVINSDATAALAIGDVIDLGQLPEGMRLEDADLIIATAMKTNVTGDLGFKYEDGVDSADAPQDAAYFINDGSLATAARVRATGHKLVVLPKPARLILTIAGAGNDKVSDIRVLVKGEMVGPR